MEEFKDCKKKVENYQRELRFYNESNFLAKSLRKITGKKPKAPKKVRFAIKYADLCTLKMISYTAFNHLEGKDCPRKKTIGVNVMDNNLGNLWTVIEYDGNGVFTDLVTGFKFIGLPSNEDDFYDDRSYKFLNFKENMDTIATEYQKLIDYPIRINESKIVPLTGEIKDAIIDETISRKEELKDFIGEQTKNNRNRLIDEYGSMYEELLNILETNRRIEEEERQAQKKEQEETESLKREEDKRQQVSQMMEEQESKKISEELNKALGIKQNN